MTARIRIADPTNQPQLRLAIEGRLDGQVYYRRVNFGAVEPGGESVVGPLGADWTSCALARTNLPIAGFSDVRVGFDLMSDGEVWIDDVQVQDVWLDDREARELLIGASTADLQARLGGLHDCRMFLDGYWPSFLRKNVKLPESRDPAPQIAGPLSPVPDPPIVARGKRAPAVPTEGGKKPNWLERTSERNKNLWPSWMKWR